MESTAAPIVFGHAAGAVALGWIYFRRWSIARPPIGVLNLSDVACMLAGVVLVPYVYLALPPALAALLLAAGILGMVYVACEPILRARPITWAVVLAIGAVEVTAAVRFGPMSPPLVMVNNVALIVAAVGVANLWAQGGMRARDAALLGGALAIYDGVATWQMPLMTDLVLRLAALPFAPLVAWHGDASGDWLGLGLGDLLVATAFPPIMRKAFGRRAGLAAMVLALAALGLVLGLPAVAEVAETFPVMVVLGPLMLLQYVWWVRRRGRERTTQEYARDEPRRRLGRGHPC